GARLPLESGQERLGGAEPLGVARAERHHRPVAAEDDAPRAEVLEEMLDVRTQALHGPVRSGLGDQARELHRGPRLLGEPPDVRRPRAEAASGDLRLRSVVADDTEAG